MEIEKMDKNKVMDLYEFQKDLYLLCKNYGIFPRDIILKRASKKVRESIFAASIELWKYLK